MCCVGHKIKGSALISTLVVSVIISILAGSIYQVIKDSGSAIKERIGIVLGETEQSIQFADFINNTIMETSTPNCQKFTNINLTLKKTAELCTRSNGSLSLLNYVDGNITPNKILFIDFDLLRQLPGLNCIDKNISAPSERFGQGVISNSSCYELSPTTEEDHTYIGNIQIAAPHIIGKVGAPIFLFISGYLKAVSIELTGDTAIIVAGDINIDSLVAASSYHLFIYSATGGVEIGAISPNIKLSVQGSNGVNIPTGANLIDFPHPIPLRRGDIIGWVR